jgi:DNA-directed RNA polymerase specialized sigma24 family protein
MLDTHHNMINHLYATRWKEWRGVARKYHQGQECMDIVHDALAYLWSRKDEFEFTSIEQTDLLIKRLIRFTALKKKRGLKANAIHIQPSELIESEYCADDSDFDLYGQQLMKVLEKHKSIYPIYFELRYLKSFSYDEIMQHMNLKSRSTVFNNYSEIRKILRHELTVE